MFSRICIAPSILSADFCNLATSLDKVIDAGAGMIHIDVMDGHFVPNLTIGVPVVKALAKRFAQSGIPLDVHLMIDNPLREIPWFLEAGATSITVHAETLDDAEMQQAIDMIRDGGAKVAVAIKPSTSVDVLKPYIRQLDMVLVMSVEPGFSGQSYIKGSEDKVAAVVELARAAGVSPLIQVDGGIGERTAPMVCAAGADVLVCGNAVFATDDPAKAVCAVTQAAELARVQALATDTDISCGQSLCNCNLSDDVGTSTSDDEACSLFRGAIGSLVSNVGIK